MAETPSITLSPDQAQEALASVEYEVNDILKAILFIEDELKKPLELRISEETDSFLNEQWDILKTRLNTLSKIIEVLEPLPQPLPEAKF